MEKKSCFNCKKAVIDGGYGGSHDEPGYPPSLDECKVQDNAIETMLDDGLTEEQLAEKCGHYDPIMVEKCSECGKEINQPQYSWAWWVTFYEANPVCSEECKKIGNAKIDAFYESAFGTLPEGRG